MLCRAFASLVITTLAAAITNFTVQVPMRDGINLNTVVYLPTLAAGQKVRDRVAHGRTRRISTLRVFTDANGCALNTASLCVGGHCHDAHTVLGSFVS